MYSSIPLTGWCLFLALHSQVYFLKKYNTVIILCLLAKNKAHMYKRHALNDGTSYTNPLFHSFNPVCIQRLNKVVIMLAQCYEVEITF